MIYDLSYHSQKDIFSQTQSSWRIFSTNLVDEQQLFVIIRLNPGILGIIELSIWNSNLKRTAVMRAENWKFTLYPSLWRFVASWHHFSSCKHTLASTPTTLISSKDQNSWCVSNHDFLTNTSCSTASGLVQQGRFVVSRSVSDLSVNSSSFFRNFCLSQTVLVIQYYRKTHPFFSKFQFCHELEAVR